MSLTKDRDEEKYGRSDGFGVDEMLMVSTSGPESLKSSSSNKSSISVGSISPPDTKEIVFKHRILTTHYFLLILWDINKFNRKETVINTNQNLLLNTFYQSLKNL